MIGQDLGDRTYHVQVYDVNGIGEALIGGLIITSNGGGDSPSIHSEVAAKFPDRKFYYNYQRQN